MSSIDRSTQLLSLALGQSARSRPSSSKRPVAVPSQASSSRLGQSSGGRAAMLQRVAQISAHDTDRERKAVRIFLEDSLANELGDVSIHDSTFVAMVDDVHRQLEADTELARACGQAGRVLLDLADKSHF